MLLHSSDVEVCQLVAWEVQTIRSCSYQALNTQMHEQALSSLGVNLESKQPSIRFFRASSIEPQLPFLPENH